MRALDLTSGRDKISSPSQPLAATVSFGKLGAVTFDASQHWQRPGLTLFNGTVYAAFASHCDAAEFHPWIFALDAMSLQVFPSYLRLVSMKQGRFAECVPSCGHYVCLITWLPVCLQASGATVPQMVIL